ncbi:hypothetical protein [Deinococcus sp. Leaf326]|uniref:hypothetical protein n=1 Tax=Deinococcus sp. Leaf326 TaxID=1736338 RepID=UPI000A889BF7|nr:hypothetical protein [Deinococcus sp. Leaf326]
MNKPKRKSTQFTFMLGYVLVAAAVGVIVMGFVTGSINSTNIVELVWALLLSAAAFLGINLSRVAAENIATIRTAGEAATNPPIADTTISNDDGDITIEQK